MLFHLSYVPSIKRQLTLRTGLSGIEPGSTVLETDVLILYTTDLLFLSCLNCNPFDDTTWCHKQAGPGTIRNRRLHPSILIRLKYQPMHEDDRNCDVALAPSPLGNLQTVFPVTRGLANRCLTS